MTHSKVEFDILDQLLGSVKTSWHRLEDDVSYMQRHEHRSKEVEEKIHDLAVAVDNIYREASKAHDCVRNLREMLLND